MQITCEDKIMKKVKFLIVLLIFSCQSIQKNSHEKVPSKQSLAQTKSVSQKSFAQFNWSDRRPIGMVFLASYPGTFTRGNRNWIIKQSPNFKRDLLALADVCVKNLKSINAQGVMIWGVIHEFYHRK
jgi:hypothetical protein